MNKQTQNIYKPYFKVFLPTCISMIMYSLYCFADVFFVAKGAGNVGIAAVNIALPVFTFFSAIGMMFGVGTSILTSIYKGKNRLDKANKVFTLYIVIGIITGIIIFTFFSLYTKEFAILLGANEVLLETTISYMRSIAPCGLLSIFIYSLPIVIRTDGNPKLAMVSGLVGNFVNIILDYVFVIVFSMGAMGAGVATTIGSIVSIIILMFHYILKKNTLKCVKDFLDLRYLKRILLNGFSSCILELSTGSVILLTNIALMSISGDAAVSIYSVITNIAFIAKNMFNATAQAAQPLISENYAKRDMSVVKASRNLAMKVAIVISILTIIVLNIFGKNFLAVFLGNDVSLLAQGVVAIAIYYSLFMFTGINTIIMYYFQSMECSKLATCVSILRGFVYPVVLLLILPKIFGIYGIWFMVSLAELLTFLTVYPFAKKQEKYINKKLSMSI